MIDILRFSNEIETAWDEFYANKSVDTLHTLFVKVCAQKNPFVTQGCLRIIIYKLITEGDSKVLYDVIDILPTYVAKKIIEQLLNIIVANIRYINFEIPERWKRS